MPRKPYEFTADQWSQLCNRIAAHGGELLNQMCGMHTYTLTGNLSKNVVIPGCGNVSIFKIPYDAPVPYTNAVVKGEIHLCAVCDHLGSTGRFRIPGMEPEKFHA